MKLLSQVVEDDDAFGRSEQPKPSGSGMARKSTQRKVNSSFFSEEEFTKSHLGVKLAPEVDTVSGEVR